MQENARKPFYIQWFCVAFTHSFSISDLVAAIIGLLITILTFWLMPTWDVNLWTSIGILGGIVSIRLLLAPYWIYKQQQKTITTMSQQSQSNTTDRIFVIESYGYEFGTSDTEGYPQLDVRRILRIDLLINAMPTTWVNSIDLIILGNFIGTDWHPDYVASGAPTGGYYYFGIPNSIKEGKYNVKLIAYAEDKTSQSEPFEIKVPK